MAGLDVTTCLILARRYSGIPMIAGQPCGAREQAPYQIQPRVVSDRNDPLGGAS
jgi:hypothetical protein